MLCRGSWMLSLLNCSWRFREWGPSVDFSHFWGVWRCRVVPSCSCCTGRGLLLWAWAEGRFGRAELLCLCPGWSWALGCAQPGWCHQPWGQPALSGWLWVCSGISLPSSVRELRACPWKARGLLCAMWSPQAQGGKTCQSWAESLASWFTAQTGEGLGPAVLGAGSVLGRRSCR